MANPIKLSCNWHYIKLDITTLEQDITNNKSKINISLKGYRDTSITTGAWLTDANYPFNIKIDGALKSSSKVALDFRGSPLEKEIGAWEGWLSHENDGTKTINASGFLDGRNPYGANIGYGTATTTYTVKTIPRVSVITTFNDFFIEDNFNINISRASQFFTHKVTLRIGNVFIGEWNDATTVLNLSFNSVHIDRMYLATKNTKEAEATLICQTYRNNNLIGTTYKKARAKVKSSNAPNFIDKATELNTKVKNLVGLFVQNESIIKFEFSNVETKNHATIKEYKIDVGGRIYSSRVAEGKIAKSGKVILNFSLTDSRGFTKTITRLIHVLAYSHVKIDEVRLIRALNNGSDNELGEHLKVKLKGGSSSLVNGTEKNVFRVKIRSKKRSESWYKDVYSYTLPNINFDGFITVPTEHLYAKEFSYDVQVIVSDIFNSSVSQGVLVSGTITQHWGREAIAVGKYIENENYSIDAKKFIRTPRLHIENGHGSFYMTHGQGHPYFFANNNKNFYFESDMYSRGHKVITESSLKEQFTRGNGYVKLPTGEILQYGTFNKTIAGGQTCTLPVAYNSYNYVVTATPYHPSYDIKLTIRNWGQAFTVYAFNKDGTEVPCTIKWLAIGKVG